MKTRSLFPSGGIQRVRSLIVALALLGTVLALGVYLREKRRVEAVRQSVRTALAARRLDDARVAIDRLAALRPRDGEPEYFRAWLRIVEDRPAEALNSLRKALERGYPQEPAYVLRAVLQARAGQLEAAEPVLRPAFEDLAEPKIEIAEGMARVFLGTFRLPDAARAVERWMAESPADARPYLWRSKIDQQLGAAPEILIHNLRQALRRDPNLDDTRLELADLLLKSHRVDEADDEYRTLRHRIPKSVAGHVGAGQAALLKGDLKGAIGHFEIALVMSPQDAVALRELGLIDLRHDRYASARDRFAQAIALSPFDPELRYNAARALQMLGDEAGSAAESAAARRIRDEQAHIAELRQALAQRPDDADLRCDAARWLIAHGHEKEGLEWTALILRQKPHHAPTCRLLADYHTKQGNAGLANYYRMAGGLGDEEGLTAKAR